MEAVCLNSSCRQGCVPSRSSGEDPYAGLSRLLEAICIPFWLVHPSLTFKASRVASSDLSLTPTSALLSHLFL